MTVRLLLFVGDLQKPSRFEKTNNFMENNFFLCAKPDLMQHAALVTTGHDGDTHADT